MPELLKQENIDVFVHQGVYTEKEVIARANIQLENYIKSIRIEALTMIEMARQDIYPRRQRVPCRAVRLHRLQARRQREDACFGGCEARGKARDDDDAMMAAVAKLERDSFRDAGRGAARLAEDGARRPARPWSRCASLPTAWKSCARPTTALSHLHGYSVQRKIMAEGEPCAPVCARAFPLERTIFL